MSAFFTEACVDVSSVSDKQISHVVLAVAYRHQKRLKWQNTVTDSLGKAKLKKAWSWTLHLIREEHKSGLVNSLSEFDGEILQRFYYLQRFAFQAPPPPSDALRVWA